MSLRPSPTRLNPRTTIKIAKPGNSENHQVSGKKEAPFATIVPRSGVGGCAPNPKKLNEAIEIIAPPKSSVAITIIIGKIFGRRI